jgi:uncharacterized protein (DUF3820 family)
LKTLKDELLKIFPPETKVKPKKTLEEQLAVIQKVVAVPANEEIPELTFSFGKYKGASLKDVLGFDRPYLEWLLKEKFMPEGALQKVSQALELTSK